ncbi:DUF4190 domain-containing protein [Nocardioides bruguierae]|uniref:DUF4190 domain-containing protein n=1 Tax=Nocardioides bruguierae TaxID=2945102 RepID=UPI00201FB434|nr:DUF4190 domain-containing protein [Nocardioides bruguierae]MCL8027559.1 DUF4190 domain-containing protein [Nocardioides bruguierae]
MSETPPPYPPSGDQPPAYGGQPSYGGQPPYGQPPYGGQPGYAQPENHPRGTLILVLGILGLVCCGLFTALPAWIMGNKARKETTPSGAPYANAGLIKAGWILGIIGTLLTVAGIAFYAVLLIVGAATGGFEYTYDSSY